MLRSELLNRKKRLGKEEFNATDLISSTFKFPKESRNNLMVVGSDENMRPDLLADRIYGKQMMWDAILKFNGISNPFSIKHGDILYAIPFREAKNSYVSPLIIPIREEKGEFPFNPLLDPKTQQDKDRLRNLQSKIGEITPPNVNRVGDKNVRIKDGKVIFGEDVTSVKKENCPIPISRNRLQAALLKDKIFI